MSTNNQNSILRSISIANYDIDLQDLTQEFSNLTELAKQVAGTEIVMFNLIDTQYHYTFSNIGFNNEIKPLDAMPCKYTILEDDYFEVENLSDTDFLNNDYNSINPSLSRYYFGIPLKTNEGLNFGTLCFFDQNIKKVETNQKQALTLITKEAVQKIEALKFKNTLVNQFLEFKASHNKIANDLRNPLAGVIGLSEVLMEQEDELSGDEIKYYNKLINDSSKSVLVILDDIITNQKNQDINDSLISLKTLDKKLEIVYFPLIKSKSISLNVSVNEVKADIFFLKNHVYNIVGRLLIEASTMIKENGVLDISLDLIIKVDQQFIKADFTSDHLLIDISTDQNQMIKVYTDKVDSLGGRLTINPANYCLFQIVLPVRSV